MASPAIAERRAFSHGRLQEFAVQLGQAEDMYGGNCCVYATGSYGRGEASRHSDLDVFIVGVTKPRSDAPKAGGESPERALNPLDETCLKSDLIRATRALQLPEFSGNGEYLQHYSFNSCKRLDAGYPSYVRGWVCMARDGSMQRGYRDVGYLFAMKLREFRPEWVSGRAWRYHLRTLWASFETCDDRAVTWWFAATYPGLAALIPARQQSHFMAGVREIACGE